MYSVQEPRGSLRALGKTLQMNGALGLTIKTWMKAEDRKQKNTRHTCTPRMSESSTALVAGSLLPAFVTNTVGTRKRPTRSVSRLIASRAAGSTCFPRTNTPSMSKRNPKFAAILVIWRSFILNEYRRYSYFNLINESRLKKIQFMYNIKPGAIFLNKLT